MVSLNRYRCYLLVQALLEILTGRLILTLLFSGYTQPPLQRVYIGLPVSGLLCQGLHLDVTHRGREEEELEMTL